MGHPLDALVWLLLGATAGYVEEKLERNPVLAQFADLVGQSLQTGGDRRQIDQTLRSQEELAQVPVSVIGFMDAIEANWIVFLIVVTIPFMISNIRRFREQEATR